MTAFALLIFGCADLAPLEAEVASLREENAELRAQVEAQTELLAALNAPIHDEPSEPVADLPPPEWLSKNSSGGWYVRRDALPDADDLFRHGRALPHRGPDGEIDGFRLSAVRRGSGFDLLGFRNGDILQTVNGTPVVDTPSAMAAGAAVASADEITVRVVRRGELVDVVFRVR